jgi:hypothetical protein
MPMLLTPMAISLRAFVAGLGLGIAACSSAQRHDEWLNYRAPAETSSPSWRSIPSTRIHRIRKEETAEALALLRDRAVHRLDPKSARGLVGRNLSPQPGQEFYLVRAVRTTSDHGAFALYSNGRSLVVSYGVLTNSTPEIQRDGIVVELPESPDQIYIEVDAAR